MDFHFTIAWEEGVRRMVQYQDSRGAIDAAPDDPLYEKIVNAWIRMEKKIIAEVSPFDR